MANAPTYPGAGFNPQIFPAPQQPPSTDVAANQLPGNNPVPVFYFNFGNSAQFPFIQQGVRPVFPENAQCSTVAVQQTFTTGQYSSEIAAKPRAKQVSNLDDTAEASATLPKTSEEEHPIEEEYPIEEASATLPTSEGERQIDAKSLSMYNNLYNMYRTMNN